jgi:hypothetical protein
MVKISYIYFADFKVMLVKSNHYHNQNKLNIQFFNDSVLFRFCFKMKRESCNTFIMKSFIIHGNAVFFFYRINRNFWKQKYLRNMFLSLSIHYNLHCISVCIYTGFELTPLIHCSTNRLSLMSSALDHSTTSAP